MQSSDRSTESVQPDAETIPHSQAECSGISAGPPMDQECLPDKNLDISEDSCNDEEYSSCTSTPTKARETGARKGLRADEKQGVEMEPQCGKLQ